MSDVSVKRARRRQLHTAALAAVLMPAALLAGCAAPAPPPPPQPQPVYVPAPQPAPHYVPAVRG